MDTTLPSVFDPAFETEPELLKAKTSLFKKFGWKKSQTLYDAVHLAHLLVVFGKEGEAIEVCRTLARIEFNGSFQYFGAVQLALALQARLCRLRGDLATAHECMERIKQAGYVDDRLEGTMLDRNGQLAEAIRTGKKRSERAPRLIRAAEQTFILELGGSEKLPASKLEKDLAENLAALKELYGVV